MRLAMIGLMFCLAGSALAVNPDERLSDPALEARARVISAGLRCLVCQNETIDESGADLAHDIRKFVRRRLALGETDAQVTGDIVDRYGEFVLLLPPVRRETWVLWFGPPMLLIAGLLGAAFWLRRGGANVLASAPLTEDEQRRLALLNPDSES